MHVYTKRQVSVLVEKAATHLGGNAPLARRLGLASPGPVKQVLGCRTNEHPLSPSIVAVLRLRTASWDYYHSDTDLREVLGLPVSAMEAVA